MPAIVVVVTRFYVLLKALYDRGIFCSGVGYNVYTLTYLYDKVQVISMERSDVQWLMFCAQTVSITDASGELCWRDNCHHR